MDPNSRMSRRHQTLGLMSNVFDGKLTVIGIVEDISRTGLRVSNIPSSFKDTVETCYMIVNGSQNDYHLVLKPRWVNSTNKGMYKTIGFQVAKAPKNWSLFLESIENKCDDDSFFIMQNGCR